MNRSIDFRHEVSRLRSSKPVYAAAGAGVLASQTLRALSARIARWRRQTPVSSLPGRATGYIHTARLKTADGYDKLADRGKRAMNGRAAAPGSPSSKTAKTSKSG